MNIIIISMVERVAQLAHTHTYAANEWNKLRKLMRPKSKSKTQFSDIKLRSLFLIRKMFLSFVWCKRERAHVQQQHQQCAQSTLFNSVCVSFCMKCVCRNAIGLDALSTVNTHQLNGANYQKTNTNLNSQKNINSTAREGKREKKSHSMFSSISIYALIKR